MNNDKMILSSLCSRFLMISPTSSNIYVSDSYLIQAAAWIEHTVSGRYFKYAFFDRFGMANLSIRSNTDWIRMAASIVLLPDSDYSDASLTGIAVEWPTSVRRRRIATRLDDRIKISWSLRWGSDTIHWRKSSYTISYISTVSVDWVDCSNHGMHDRDRVHQTEVQSGKHDKRLTDTSLVLLWWIKIVPSWDWILLIVTMKD